MFFRRAWYVFPSKLIFMCSKLTNFMKWKKITNLIPDFTKAPNSNSIFFHTLDGTQMYGKMFHFSLELLSSLESSSFEEKNLPRRAILGLQISTDNKGKQHNSNNYMFFLYRLVLWIYKCKLFCNIMKCVQCISKEIGK